MLQHKGLGTEVRMLHLVPELLQTMCQKGFYSKDWNDRSINSK